MNSDGETSELSGAGVVSARDGSPVARRIRRTVSELSQCEFYHAVELPDGSVTSAEWDLRPGVEKYLGKVDFSGRRVLEIGPASGFLSFHMEKQGAKVIAVEPPIDTFWDLVPRAGVDLESLKNQFRSHIERIRNSFWYLHGLNQSDVELYEASAYALPDELGTFDTGLLACVLLHCSCPVRMIESVSRRVSRTLIVCEVYHEELGSDPVCGLLPAGNNDLVDTWWRFSPTFFVNYLAVLGFTSSRVIRHRQLVPRSSTWVEMFTVVSNRP